MSKAFDLEELAKLDMEQLDELATGEQDEVEEPEVEEQVKQQEGDELTEDGEKEVVEEERVSTDAATEETPEDEDDGMYVETKNGKGRIPYKELESTRKALAEAKQRLEQLESRSSYKAELPEGYDNQVKAVDTKLDELGQDFEEGNLEWDDFKMQQANLLNEREKLRLVAVKAEIAQEMTQQQAEHAQEQAAKAWDATVSSFLAEPHDGVDYQQDQERLASLDMYVKLLGNDPRNNDKDLQWFVDTAHKAVVALHGAVQQPAKEGVTSKLGKAAQKVADHEQKPPFGTLSDIPGGSPPDVSELEKIGSMSGALLTKRFMENPELIEKYIAELG